MSQMTEFERSVLNNLLNDYPLYALLDELCQVVHERAEDLDDKGEQERMMKASDAIMRLSRRIKV